VSKIKKKKIFLASGRTNFVTNGTHYGAEIFLVMKKPKEFSYTSCAKMRKNWCAVKRKNWCARCANNNYGVECKIFCAVVRKNNLGD
jgi:hypothetical protein